LKKRVTGEIGGRGGESLRGMSLHVKKKVGWLEGRQMKRSAEAGGEKACVRERKERRGGAKSQSPYPHNHQALAIPFIACSPFLSNLNIHK